MQFRLLATTATKLHPVFFSEPNPTTIIGSLPRRLASSASTGRTSDPALYCGDPQKIEEEEFPHGATAYKQTEQIVLIKEEDTFVPPKVQPASSPKLESAGVNQPIQPHIQQKRHNSTSPNIAPTEEVSCVGLDGSPWPEEDDKSDGEWRRERKEQEAEDKEYFSRHKASPLSEIEVADSRKPLRKATDGTVDSHVVGGGNRLILFREEQLDTAEEALMRAAQMWKEAAARGDPDSPHGRILRALRGENW